MKVNSLTRVLLLGTPWTAAYQAPPSMGFSRQEYWSGLPFGSVVKNPPANAGDVGLIPGLKRFPGEGMAAHSSILAWRIPWMEEPGRLQSTGSRRVGHD